AKKLPRTIGDDPRIAHARGHTDEVWRFLYGARFDEARTNQEKEDKNVASRELVEQFLDAETRERRRELEKELKTVDGGALEAGSGRLKRRLAILTKEFLKTNASKTEIKRRLIIERGRHRFPWLLQLTKERRPPRPKVFKSFKELERGADEFLK